MRTFTVPHASLQINRGGCLIDSNLLIAAFGGPSEEDEYPAAWIKLNEFLVHIYVLDAVIVESWGVLVGRDGNRQGGLEMLQWLSSSGNAVVVPSRETNYAAATLLVRTVDQLDLVDALLLVAASRITRTLEIGDPFKIATYDTGDFLAAYDIEKVEYSLIDLNTDERVV